MSDAPTPNFDIAQVAYLFDGQPSRVQLALNGDWEKATKCELGPSSATLEKQMLEPLMEATNDVALEVFFGAKHHAMIGLRYSSTLNVSKHDFVLEVVGLAQRSNDFIGFGEGLVQLGNQWGFRAFAGGPILAELGVLDHWKSLPTFELWRTPAPRVLPLDIGLSQAPHLIENNVNHIMLEFAFDGTVEHWLGLIVSEPNVLPYRLDPIMLKTAFLGFDFVLEPHNEMEHA